MSNLQSAIRYGAGHLTGAGVDSPQLDAELLLAHTLGLTRAGLYARLHEPLEHRQQVAYDIFLNRRRGREPLAYIVGHKSFYDFDLTVNRHVLIPRPETEHLIEHALALGPSLPTYPTLTIADVGTGSGALAIALARQFPRAHVVATDNQLEALTVARLNVQTLGLSGRVQPVAGDLLAPTTGPFALVVANLPYISHNDIDSLSPEIASYEPRTALDGGTDGLSIVRRLLPQLPGRLVRGGIVLLEIGAGQAEQLAQAVHHNLHGWSVRFHTDYAGHLRVAELCAADHACAATV